jgi:hypothetical protein
MGTIETHDEGAAWKDRPTAAAGSQSGGLSGFHKDYAAHLPQIA